MWSIFPSENFKVLKFDPDICTSLSDYLVNQEMFKFDHFLHWNTNMAEAIVNSFVKTAEKVNLLYMEWK